MLHVGAIAACDLLILPVNMPEIAEGSQPSAASAGGFATAVVVLDLAK